jgi:beta-lactam-binding protein with PASTA domain
VTVTLKSAGFTVGKVTVALLDSVTPAGNTASGAEASQAASPASIIVSQDPVPGSKVLAGSAINFVVK